MARRSNLNRMPGRAAAGLAALLACAAGQPAWAQKNTGPVLPTSPAPTYQAPRPAAPPPMAPALAPQAGATNPEAERLAQSLPLDPMTRELRDSLPPDPVGTQRRLGLRAPRGPATDLRGRTPSSREIVDALAPR